MQHTPRDLFPILHGLNPSILPPLGESPRPSSRSPQSQLRRVKSTVHLTGRPSDKTKQRLIDLLAPSKSEVVTTTGSAGPSRVSSYTDLTALEAGGGGGLPQEFSFRGVLREEDCEEDGDGGTAPVTDDGLDDSIFGGGGGGEGSAFGGSRRGLGGHSKVSVWLYVVWMAFFSCTVRPSAAFVHSRCPFSAHPAVAYFLETCAAMMPGISAAAR